MILFARTIITVVHHLCQQDIVCFQEPVVFSGTIRDNLDPYGQYNDLEIWDSLKHSHLKSFVIETKRGLDFECGEDGSNMRSVQSAWWHHEMETFSALLALCAGNSQRPVTRSCDVFLYLRLNKRLSNSRDAGDSRRHRAHYDVTVMRERIW